MALRPGCKVISSVSISDVSCSVTDDKRLLNMTTIDHFCVESGFHLSVE